jgi:Heparinase II/III-like protein
MKLKGDSVRRRRQTWVVAIAVWILLTGTYNSFAATITPGRPRVMLTAADVGALRNKCLTISPYREVYQSLKSRVDGWTSPTTNRYVVGQQIEALVFVALIENYNAAYLAKVDQWIRNVYETQGAVGLAASGDAGAIWGSADIILGTAWALDWLYPALNPATRLRYGTNLRDFQEAVINRQGGTARDGSRADYSNQFYYFDGMLSITGIALSGAQIDDARAAAYIQSFDTYVRQNMLPVVNQVGGTNGGWHEGLGYVDRAMTTFAQEVEAWRVATGEDLFPQASGLRNLSKWVLYSTQPDGIVANIGDVSAWPVGWTTDTAKRGVLLGARYKDGYSQYLANRTSATSNWWYAPFYLLWYDASVAETVLASTSKDAYFDGIGWVSMHSGWGASDVFALFTSGNYYFGHQHLDQNSFQIFRSAPLAIDNGIYNAGAPAYKMATRFHNTILVGDPGAASAETDGAAGQTSAGPQLYLSNPEASSSDKGDIVKYETTPQYTYVVGDATKAYSSSRLTGYIRKVVYAKPDYFLIVDRVAVPTTSFPIRWMHQAESAPVINGLDVTVTNGGGKLQQRTLLPADAVVTNYTVFAGDSGYGGGNYRTEVVPGTRRLQETFVHVLWATSSGASQAIDARLVRSQSGSLVGAQFGSHIALVSESTQPQTTEVYTATGTASIDHMIADLVPSGRYDVLRNGAALVTVVASTSGVLSFASPGGGTFTVRVAGTQPTPPASPRNLRIVP